MHADDLAGGLVIVVAPGGRLPEGWNAALARHPDLALLESAHVLSGLAHLGPYRNVYKAAYDHVLAAQAQGLFIERASGGWGAYAQACRAYCGVLYSRYRGAVAGRLVVDATPGYAGLLPVIARVLPETRVVAVLDHPLAIAASTAGVRAAYVRGMRAVVARVHAGAPTHLVHTWTGHRDPRGAMESLCRFLGVANAQAPVEGANFAAPPLTSRSRATWARLCASLPASDWKALGFDLERLRHAPPGWEARPLPKRTAAGSCVAVKRCLQTLARGAVRRHRRLRQGATALCLACDVVLRPE